MPRANRYFLPDHIWHIVVKRRVGPRQHLELAL